MARDRQVESGGLAPLWAIALTICSAAAQATGFPPITGEDAASVVRGGTVSRLTNGSTSVLANDRDLEGDAMTAVLAENPARGSLVLNADGTFLYTHNGSSQNSDRFRYRAFDGTRFSRQTDVRITITNRGVAPQIVGQRPLSVAEDGALQIALQDLVVQDSDSNFPQDFTLSVGPGANYTVEGTTIRPASNFNGSLSVPTQVNDGQSNSNVFNAVVQVTPVNDPPIVTQPLGDREATEGLLFELDVRPAFSDVDANDTLTFTAAGLPVSRSLTLNPASGVLSGTPQAADVRPQPYSVSITAHDAAGASASSTFALTIAAVKADVAIRAKVDPNPATFAAAAAWSIDVENLGNSATAAGEFRAEWFSSGPALTLTAPATCNITGNATAHVDVQCSFAGIPVSAKTTIAAQTTQQAAGDVALIARLLADDGDALNNTAIANLNLAGGFSEGPAQVLDARGADLAVGDIDTDGLLDVAAVGDEARVFYNTGQKSLAAGPALGSASAGTAVALIDWNLDGRLDIAVLDRGTRSGRVFLNDGQRGFAQSAALPASNVAAVAVVDLDGDQVAELVVAGDAGTRTVARDAQVTTLHPAAARHVATADLNADGRADLVITDAASRALHVLLSNGTGFDTSTLSGNGSAVSATLRDVDGNTSIDLLLAIDGNDFQPPANVLLRNDGNGRFTTRSTFGASRTQQLLAGDIDGDRLVDIGVINLSGTHQFYLRTAQGDLTLQGESVRSPSAQRAHLIDLDGDTYPDLLLGGAESPTIELYRNNGLGRFGRGDVTAPVITLLGAATLRVKVGDAYTDPGATARDDVQGDLTAQIVVNGAVDPAIVGTYAVRYNVTDRAGNRAPQVERTVVIEPKVEGGGGGGGNVGYALTALLALLVALRRKLTANPCSGSSQ